MHMYDYKTRPYQRPLARLQPKIKTMARLLQPLKQLPHVGEIRQQGFIVAIELVEDKQTKKPYRLEERIGHKVSMEARSRGLLLRPIGNVMVLMPPLSTSIPELRRMVEILREAIETVTLPSTARAGS